MKIIPPSFEILDFLDQQGLAVRIEHCGRICYKSEGRITPESALPFIKNVIERGHNSVLEMGVVTLEVVCKFREYINLLKTIPKYLHLTNIEPEGPCWLTPESKSRLLITASIRAWREMLINHPNCSVIHAACAFLAKRHPYFFDSILPVGGYVIDSRISVRKVSLEDVGDLPVELVAKHRHIAVKFIVNRAISHEICRHRAMAILQTSQRYCNYASGKFGNEVTFIRPSAFFDCEITGKSGLCGCDNQAGEFCDDCVSDMSGFYSGKPRSSAEYSRWLAEMQGAEDAYLWFIEKGHSPQAARTVLPNSCKTEIIVYANLEQWQHIFKLRCSKVAEPSMREMTIPLREEFAKRWPGVFENV